MSRYKNFSDKSLTFNISFYDYFIKNPQTTIALPFLTHNISAIGGVSTTDHWIQEFIKRIFGSGLCWAVAAAEK